tara:strand:+ start:284 stop:418 length:135 start_codon:yes stop_codon:yes gene_type:complete
MATADGKRKTQIGTMESAQKGELSQHEVYEDGAESTDIKEVTSK